MAVTNYPSTAAKVDASLVRCSLSNQHEEPEITCRNKPRHLSCQDAAAVLHRPRKEHTITTHVGLTRTKPPLGGVYILHLS